MELVALQLTELRQYLDLNRRTDTSYQTDFRDERTRQTGTREVQQQNRKVKLIISSVNVSHPRPALRIEDLLSLNQR